MTASRIERLERFERVKSGYEADGPDSTVPGATSVHSRPGRYAVVTVSLRGHGYFVNYASALMNVEIVAAANLGEGWQPVCYFDLDDLGDPLPPYEGDIVNYGGERHHVVLVTDDVAEGELYHKLYLHKTDAGAMFDECELVDEDDVEILERGEPDDRMPVRYGVAKIHTVVVFNTIPSPLNP